VGLRWSFSETGIGAVSFWIFTRGNFSKFAHMESAVQNKEAILSLLQMKRNEIRRFGVSKLSLFGSFLTDRFHADSDVDFLVEFHPNMKTYDHFMELSFFLEDLLGRRVELVTPQSLSPYIGPHILKEAQHVAL